MDYFQNLTQNSLQFSIGHFRVILCLCFKASLSANHSYENDFDLHENETACRTHFHMKGFALRLVLKQRHKRTRNWPILHLFAWRTPYWNLLVFFISLIGFRLPKARKIQSGWNIVQAGMHLFNTSWFLSFYSTIPRYLPGPVQMSTVTGLARLPGRILSVHAENLSPVDRDEIHETNGGI